MDLPTYLQNFKMIPHYYFEYILPVVYARLPQWKLPNNSLSTWFTAIWPSLPTGLSIYLSMYLSIYVSIYQRCCNFYGRHKVWLWLIMPALKTKP